MAARCAAIAPALSPDAVFCGPSAAALHGLAIPHRLSTGPVVVAVPEGMPRVRRRLITPRQLDLTTDEIVIVRGLRVASPARTYCDLARDLWVPDLAAVGDMVLRDHSTAREALEAVVRRRIRYHGKVRARETLELLDPRAESPQESRTRVHLHLGALPTPEVNFVVLDRSGNFVARVDLAYPEAQVAVEYDGEIHFTRDQRDLDATRRLVLQRAGWLVVEITAADLTDPRVVVDKVRSALRSRRVLW